MNPMPTMQLIRNADVYAPEPLGVQQLLLGGGKVLWIGRELAALPVALPVEVIDLGGRRLIPGLIDGHVHVTGGGGEAGFSTRVPAPMLSRYTRAGVTSVVGLLGTDDVARSTRELVASIYALREQGLNAWGYSGGYHLPPTTLTGSVRGDIVFAEAVELARRGCCIDITAELPSGAPVAEGEDAWSAADALQRYLDSGAPVELVTISSDAGGCLPCFDHDGRVCGMAVGESGALLATLNELLGRGLAMAEALPAFTSNPARLLRLAGKGRIAAGADADLVALDANGAASDVLIAGVTHVRAGEVQRRGIFEG